jgi:hypothetical protein
MIMTDTHIHSSKEEHTGLKTILVVEDDTDVGDFLVQAIRLESHYQAKGSYGNNLMILVRIGASRGYYKSDTLIMLFPNVP